MNNLRGFKILNQTIKTVDLELQASNRFKKEKKKSTA